MRRRDPCGRKKLGTKPERQRSARAQRTRKSPHHSRENPAIEPFVNRIFCGDALFVLPGIPSESVDLVITSPPYNFGHDYAQDPHDDTHEWNEYFATLNVVWTECARVLRPGGRMAVNVQPLFSDYVPTHHILSTQSPGSACSGKRSFSGRRTTTTPSTPRGELEVAVHALHQVHVGICRGL